VREKTEYFAYGFAEAGADLILTARSEEALQAVGAKCRALGRNVTVVTGDVSIEADVQRVITQGLSDHKKIDVLITTTQGLRIPKVLWLSSLVQRALIRFYR